MKYKLPNKSDFKSFCGSAQLSSDVTNVCYSSFKCADNAYYRNTEEIFLTAIRSGFKVLKADIRVSGDGRFILCHDKGFTLKDGKVTAFDAENENTVFINDTPYDELKNLQFDNEKHLGYSSAVSNIDSFLKLCSENDVAPYLTLREEFASNYIYDGENTRYFCAPSGVKVGDYLIEKLLSALSSYGLSEKAYLNCFASAVRMESPWIINQYTDRHFVTKAIIDKIRAVNSGVKVLWVQTREFKSTDEDETSLMNFKGRIDYLSSLEGCNILCLYCRNNTDYIDSLSYVLSYAAFKGVPVFNALVSEADAYEYMIEKGISGFQIYPEIVEIL